MSVAIDYVLVFTYMPGRKSRGQENDNRM